MSIIYVLKLPNIWSFYVLSAAAKRLFKAYWISRNLVIIENQNIIIYIFVSSSEEYNSNYIFCIRHFRTRLHH